MRLGWSMRRQIPSTNNAAHHYYWNARVVSLSSRERDDINPIHVPGKYYAAAPNPKLGVANFQLGPSAAEWSCFGFLVAASHRSACKPGEEHYATIGGPVLKRRIQARIMSLLWFNLIRVGWSTRLKKLLGEFTHSGKLLRTYLLTTKSVFSQDAGRRESQNMIWWEGFW